MMEGKRILVLAYQLLNEMQLTAITCSHAFLLKMSSLSNIISNTKIFAVRLYNVYNRQTILERLFKNNYYKKIYHWFTTPTTKVIFHWMFLSFQIYWHEYCYLWKCLKYNLSTYLFQILKVNILAGTLEPSPLLSYEILFRKQIKVDKSVIYVQVLFLLELFFLSETESDNALLIIHRIIWV